MSQSDYIRYKRVAVELSNQRENLTPVIGSGQYINYKAFTLENTILSDNNSLEKLYPSSSVNVFGMQKNHPSTCASFKLCSETNSRLNRRPVLGIYSTPRPLYKTKPHVTPLKLDICDYC